MPLPLADISAVPGANTSPTNHLTARQRAEGDDKALPTAGTALAQAESSQALSSAELLEPVQRVNEAMKEYGVQFEMSEPPGERLVTRIVDQSSGDVIRQIPTEEVLAFAQQLAEQLHSPNPREQLGQLINLKA